VNFRPENEANGGASGGPPDGPPDEGLPKVPEERGERGRFVSSLGPVPFVVGLLLLALVVGVFLLWRSYGDRVGGISVFEDSVESGAEPVVRLTNGPGWVRVEGVGGLENVEITAQRYARGSNPTAAKENADRVPVDVTNDGSTVEISSEGGRGTGADYDVRVPPGSVVEIDSSAGDVEVSGLDGEVRVRAESGDISVNDVRGPVAIEAPQGDVALEGVSTETGNAKITVDTGDVELEDLVVGILETRVETGDVTLSGRFSGGGWVIVETGSIYARLPSEDTRELTLETRVGEVIRNDEQGSG
jgi:hypothetical protein